MSQFIEMFGNERIEDCKWQNLPMGHVFEISSSRRVLKEQWTSDGVPFLRVRDMVDLAQGKELNNEAFISEKYYNKLSDDDGKVREGDIIISATSTIGKCYLIKKGDRFYYKDADILRLRKQKEINCSYFMYAFNMPTIAMQVEESIGKTTVGHFLISKAQNIKIPMPPIELQVQFESILHQADKSGFDGRKSQFIEMFAPYPYVPLSYYVSSLIGGRSLDGGTANSNRVLKTGSVSYNYFVESEYKFLPDDYVPNEAHKVKIGDVIISRMNTPEYVGACAYVSCLSHDVYLPDRLWKVEIKDNVHPIFLWQSLIQDSSRMQIKKLASGTSNSMKNISKNNLLGIFVKEVPICKQMKFVEIYKQADKSGSVLQHMIVC